MNKEAALTNISAKVDTMKLHVNEMKNSYMETIKEESENRRTKFYNNNINDIYDVYNDKGSVKSD